MTNSAHTQPSDLFGACEELPPCGPLATAPQVAGGAPRLLTPDRSQIELRSFDLEASLPAEHPARTVWRFVQALELSELRAKVKSVQGRAGAPAIDPAVLVALWLFRRFDMSVGAAPTTAVSAFRRNS